MKKSSVTILGRIAAIATTAMALVCFCPQSHAQELQAKITINHNQIQGTDKSVFENLRQTLEQFVNDRQWTNLQFQKNERIQCSFNITVTKYDKSSNLFTCKALIQASRPVYNSAYTTTIYNNSDNEFTFEVGVVCKKGNKLVVEGLLVELQLVEFRKLKCEFIVTIIINRRCIGRVVHGA